MPRLSAYRYSYMYRSQVSCWKHPEASLLVSIPVLGPSPLASNTSPVITSTSHSSVSWYSTRYFSSATFCNNNKVRIGHVELDLSKNPAQDPYLIPKSYLPSDPSQRSPTLLRHLQWMLSKDALGQDMMLVGSPGSGSLHRRNLALMYAEMTQREVEVLTLSSDVTESDLKQRKELVHKPIRNVVAATAAAVEFADQAPVRAALGGRILILDGLEKAERNVLPTINNLLENREINLEDGRLLVSPKRYNELLSSRSFDADNTFLVPTHPNFRVVALATPAPPYPGRGIDPPLRSRFQIRRVDNPSAEEIYSDLINSGANVDIASQLSAFAAAMDSAASDFSSGPSSSGRTLVFPSNALVSAAHTLDNFPREDCRSVLARLYPAALPDERFERVFGPSSKESSRKSFDRACDELGIIGKVVDKECSHMYEIDTIERSASDPFVATVSFSAAPLEVPSSFFGGRNDPNSSGPSVKVSCGSNELHRRSPSFVRTQGTSSVFTSMMQEHAAGRDILLISPRGEGKSTITAEFASLLGYDTALFNLYREMSGRDLLQRRATDPTTGETRWEDSALVKAACHGDLCILDGVERLASDTVTTLHSLMTEREISLPDGSKLVRADRMRTSIVPSSLIRPVHPSFRVIALASLTKDRSFLLSDDVMSAFSTLLVPTPSVSCMKAILRSANPTCPDSVIDKLLHVRAALAGEAAVDCGVQPLSTRNLLRIVKLENSDDGTLYNAISSVLLADLLPPTQRASLESLLNHNKFMAPNKRGMKSRQNESIVVNEGTASIGDMVFIRREAKRPELVPTPEFINIPSQVQAIKGLLNEINAGERSFLLLGNQGVGKNKLTDRLCELANFEREYIQLHRDSTIGSLTLSPSLEYGKIVWKDSPLLRAVKNGAVLVVDEADKAPTEVIAVLKSLVEDGELLLADGRRISRHNDGKGVIKIHPDFTLFVLANRPGYPFHGNDFFFHDCFSVLVCPNPDLDSEIALLTCYGPEVDSQLIRQVAASFDHLRRLADNGDISYPYSTREAVAVIRHLQQYPQDGVVSAVHNVLDFDSFNDSMYAMIGSVFAHHGIEMSDYASWQEAQARVQAAAEKALEIEYTKQRDAEGRSSSPPPLSAPHQGKWDDMNNPHVGGNQWAGGTGGSDTAGLGGRGGPYRLDRGHNVHQVSDEAKAEVSEEAKRAAREMAKKALAEKLTEIEMSETEWQSYTRLLEPIRKDIGILRNSLKAVEGEKSEKTWIKRQGHGEIDDGLLPDAVAGEKYIYKRRGYDDNAFKHIHRPKRLLFVVDASASMYRFNGYDGRLNRSLEATLLIMSAFEGMGDRFDYGIVAHSGDSPTIPLVRFGDPPTNEKDMMRILQSVVAHTQYCQSGDYTLEAVENAIEQIMNGNSDGDESDEYVVVAISDANLARYGIHPKELGKIVAAGSDAAAPVKAHVIFIASFGQEAEDITRSLPAGRGHICMDTSDLPRIVRNILMSSVE